MESGLSHTTRKDRSGVGRGERVGSKGCRDTFLFFLFLDRRQRPRSSQLYMPRECDIEGTNNVVQKRHTQRAGSVGRVILCDELAERLRDKRVTAQHP